MVAKLVVEMAAKMVVMMAVEMAALMVVWRVDHRRTTPPLMCLLGTASTTRPLC